MNLDEHVRRSIYKAVTHVSGITDEIVKMPGMSSQKVRHLLNNLCNFEGCRYLEIGTWIGSTLISAIYGHPNICYWAIDNWSEWRGDENPRDYFMHNFKSTIGTPPKNLIEQDFRLVDIEKAGIKDVNVFFYDGSHGEPEQRAALVHYLPGLAEEFVFIVDDWNEASAKSGTEAAIKELGLHAIYHQVLPAVKKPDEELWWNGLGVYVLKKMSAPSAVKAA
jgi:hypothetical protein